MSVGRRLFFLVAIQTAIAFLLVVVAVRTISRIAADYRHMYEFQFKSVAAIGRAMAQAETLNPGFRSAKLDDFYRRYREEWETASGTSPDAILFRKSLSESGATDLTWVEREVLMDLKGALDAGQPESLRKDLETLYDVNLKYAALANESFWNRIRHGLIWVVVIGLGGTTQILFLGLHVRRAVAPRIKRLVTHVRDFQNTGKRVSARE
jgi:hypothetical protein